MQFGVHVKHKVFLPDFNETLIFSAEFRKNTVNIKFHENPCIGSGVVPCERTDGQTDMTKITITFRNFAKGPKNPAYPYTGHALSGSAQFLTPHKRNQNWWTDVGSERRHKR